LQDVAEVKADWSINPILYNGNSWPKIEFVDVPEFGTRAARFESDARSLGTIRGDTGHGPTIMNWRKYVNSNTKEMSSGTALGNVPLNDLYLRYCVMLEEDAWTGMNELGVKLGGLTGRSDGRGTNKVAVVFWHAKPDSQGRIRLTTYWFGDDLMEDGYGGDYIQGKYLLPNTWHCLEQHLKVNTVNPDGTPNADAVLEAWIDDELVYSRHNFVIHRYNYHAGTYPLEINQVHGQIYHGGQQTPLTPIHYRVTGFALSHKRIGAPQRLF
jgi:hypothetical protein